MTQPAPLTLPLGGKRPPPGWRKKDAVYTDVALARFLVGLLPWEGIRTVLEPSVGGGAWVEAVRLEAGRDCDSCDGYGHGYQEDGSLGECVVCFGHSVLPSIVGVDIAPDCPGAFYEAEGYEFQLGDIREIDPRRKTVPVSLRDRFDRAVGNPIYSAIPEQVNRTLELADEVAFLLPMHIVSGGEDLPRWLLDSPLRAYWPLVQRPWPKKLRGCGFFWWARDLPPLRERMDEPVGFPAREWR